MVQNSFLEPLPEVHFLLEVVPSLASLMERGEPLHVQLTQAFNQKVDELYHVLGLPGKALLEFSLPEHATFSEGQFFCLSVDGRYLRYPDELPRWVFATITGSLRNSGTSLAEILQWLESICQERDDSVIDQALLVEFFQLACLEVLKSQPAALVGPAQVEAYRAALYLHHDPDTLENHSWPPPADWLLQVLRIVVGMGISIRNVPDVSNWISEKLESDPEDAGETLTAALHPKAMEIHLPEAYLRPMNMAGMKKGGDLFPFMRDGLFVELGVACPRFHLVLDDSLKPGCFAFTVNHLTSLPMPGLQPDQILVNDTSDRIRLLGIEAEPAINPATMMPAAIVPAQHKESLEETGLTTWNQEGYLILCLAAWLRRNMWRITNRDTVQEGLDQLAKAFPNIVNAALGRYSVETITRIERGLLAEQQSVRNLRQVLERMLDYPFSNCDLTRFLVLDDRPTTLGTWANLKPGSSEHLLAFVRSGLKAQISHKLGRSTNTVVVYLLDAEIEQMVVQKYDNREEVAEKIIRAIRQELNFLPPTAQTPAILTTVEVRPVIWEILQPELSRIAVTCYDELLPDTNIQPVARISLPVEPV